MGDTERGNDRTEITQQLGSRARNKTQVPLDHNSEQYPSVNLLSNTPIQGGDKSG